MAATTRPYLCIFNGKAHMVDAKDPGAVVRHIVGAAVTELRPAHAREVAQWAREKKEIEIAGVTVAVASTADTSSDITAAEFTVDDAWAWVNEKMGIAGDDTMTVEQSIATRALRNASVAGQMDLMQFDEARVAIPGFSDAIANLYNGDTVDGIRAMLESMPIPFEEVVEAIADQKRREMFEPDQSEADITGESLG